VNHIENPATGFGREGFGSDDRSVVAFSLTELTIHFLDGRSVADLDHGR